MVISLSEGTKSTYNYIDVLELTPTQVADNNALAMALAERAIAFAEVQLPAAIEEIIPPEPDALPDEPVEPDNELRLLSFMSKQFKMSAPGVQVSPLSHVEFYLRDVWTEAVTNNPLSHDAARKKLRDSIFAPKESDELSPKLASLLKILGDNQEEAAPEEKKAPEADLTDPRVQAFEKLMDDMVDPFMHEVFADTKSFRSSIVMAAFSQAFSDDEDGKLHQLQKAFLDRLNITSIENAVTPDSSLSFAEARDAEIERRGFFLDAITEIMAERGIALDARKLAKDYADTTHRVMSSSKDFIVADHLGDHYALSAPDEKIFTFVQETSPDQHLSYRFAFFTLLVPEKDGEPEHRRTAAAYIVDPRILEDLKACKGDDKLDQRLLQGFLTVARVADHDYFHGMTASDATSAFVAPQSPSQQNDVAEAIGRKVAFIQYERLSQHMQYEVMQRMYARQPQMKERILEHAVDYMEDVQEFRRRMTEAHPEKAAEAAETAEFITQMYAGRLFHLLSYNDPDLHKVVQTERGRNASIMEQMDAIYHAERPAIDINRYAEDFQFKPERVLRSAVHDIAHIDPASLPKVTSIVKALGDAALFPEKIRPPRPDSDTNFVAWGGASLKEYEASPLEIKTTVNQLYFLAKNNAYSPEAVKENLESVRAALLAPESMALISEAEREASLKMAERIGENSSSIADLLHTLTAAFVRVSSPGKFPAVHGRKTVDMAQGEAQFKTESTRPVQAFFEQTFTFEDAEGAYPKINPVKGFNAFRQRYNSQTLFMLETVQNVHDLGTGYNQTGSVHYTDAVNQFNLVLKEKAAGLFDTTPTRYQRAHTEGMLNVLESRDIKEATRAALEYDYFMNDKTGILTQLDRDLRREDIREAMGAEQADGALIEVRHLGKILKNVATRLEAGGLTLHPETGYGQAVSEEKLASLAAMKDTLRHEAAEIAGVVTQVQKYAPEYNADEISQKLDALNMAASQIAVQKKATGRGV